MVTYMVPYRLLALVQYETEDGRCPFADWFDKLDVRAALRVRTALARIETGNFGNVKPIGGGLSERRLTLGPDYRIYFGRDGQKLVVLLADGTKQRQSRDIERARTYWKDYQGRKERGE